MRALVLSGGGEPSQTERLVELGLRDASVMEWE